ncbi:MAG TPA: DUF89 family protein [Thermoplasmatales archaeon]|nr:DUF89 family protein [Thermoplasmatales archaeon]
MKIQPECVPCLIRRSLYEIELHTKDSKKACDAILAAIKALVDVYNPSLCSAEIATIVHKAVYNALETRDPYREVKERSNRVALSILPKIERIVMESEDPLRASVICSIIGNILDFGIEGGSKSPEDLLHDFDKYLREGLGHDDYGKMKDIISNSRRIVLVTDNCGEIVFDKVLCREIKRFNPDLFLSLVVRGEPILSDATREDVVRLGFEEVVDEVLDTGTFAVGLDLKNIPKRLARAFESSDLIICKGMANYEVFSELNYKPIVYLLRTKCTAIARSMGLKLGINAIKIYE